MLSFLGDSFLIIPYCFRFVNNFFIFFSTFFVRLIPGYRERRRRDLNPRAAINDLHPFQGCPFGLLGTSPSEQNLLFYISLSGAFLSVPQRREWDSNPRALADKRFSRPPRYDHFDTSPQMRFSILIDSAYFVKRFFVFYFLATARKNCVSFFLWRNSYVF